MYLIFFMYYMVYCEKRENIFDVDNVPTPLPMGCVIVFTSPTYSQCDRYILALFKGR